jgi:hypothetical protein
MPTPDADQIVVAVNGNLYAEANPPPTAAPTNTATALNAAFINMGYISDEGATITVGQTTQSFGAWQTPHPVKTIVTGRSLKIETKLIEWDEVTWELVFGGQAADNSAEWSFTPDDSDDVRTWSIVLEWENTSANAQTNDQFRLYIPTAVVTGDTSFVLNRKGIAELPLTIEAVQDATSTSAWTLFTDYDPMDPT